MLNVSLIYQKYFLLSSQLDYFQYMIGLKFPMQVYVVFMCVEKLQ